MPLQTGSENGWENWQNHPWTALPCLLTANTESVMFIANTRFNFSAHSITLDLGGSKESRQNSECNDLTKIKSRLEVFLKLSLTIFNTTAIFKILNVFGNPCFMKCFVHVQIS